MARCVCRLVELVCRLSTKEAAVLQTCCPVSVPVRVSASSHQSIEALRQHSKGSKCSARDCFDYQLAPSSDEADLFLDANNALTWTDGSLGESATSFQTPS